MYYLVGQSPKGNKVWHLITKLLSEKAFDGDSSTTYTPWEMKDAPVQVGEWQSGEIDQQPPLVSI